MELNVDRPVYTVCTMSCMAVSFSTPCECIIDQNIDSASRSTNYWID